MLTSEKKRDMMEKAREAALQAGAFLQERSAVHAAPSGNHDTKLIADSEAENMILAALGDEFTALAEESGGHLDEDAPSWIIDPLDGTVNYSRQLPFSAISICLWHEEPILGVVYDFVRGDMFTAIVGEGAWLNDKDIRVSDTTQKSQAIALTGFPAKLAENTQALGDFIGHIQEFKKIRLLGSAALSLAYVACGRADYYRERQIRVWDVAAGLALVKAAGGQYDIAGSDPLSVTADNGSLES